MLKSCIKIFLTTIMISTQLLLQNTIAMDKDEEKPGILTKAWDYVTLDQEEVERLRKKHKNPPASQYLHHKPVYGDQDYDGMSISPEARLHVLEKSIKTTIEKHPEGEQSYYKSSNTVVHKMSKESIRLTNHVPKKIAYHADNAAKNVAKIGGGMAVGYGAAKSEKCCNCCNVQ